MATEVEIGVLEALAALGEMLESKPGTCTPAFRSRVLKVDRQKSMLLLDCCNDEAANAALLALPRADFQHERGEWRIAFVSRSLSRVSHEAAEAIQVAFPDDIAVTRRRMYQRTQNPQPPLRFEANCGTDALVEAVVTDVSRGGVGIIIDSATALAPGMVLSGCRLECQGSEPVIIDLEVRYTKTTAIPGRRQVIRAGCRFLHLSPAALAFVARFVDARPAKG